MEGVGFPWKTASCIPILLMLGGGFSASGEEIWCYDLPRCGPATWASIGSCNGKRQSPIAIDTKKAIFDRRLGPIYYNGYEDRELPRVIKNNGHFAVVEFNPGAFISNPELPLYNLRSFHFHWGTDTQDGAEHTIDGQRYSMELHLVHTKGNLTLEEAGRDPEGYAVLAFFIKSSGKTSQTNAWNTLANLVKHIPEKGDSRDLNGEFSLGGLLNVADVSHYYRYRGSLTTPDCNEAVIWTVFPDPIEVSPVVIKKLTTSLFFTNKREKRLMQNTFRPQQPLNRRKVFYYREDPFLDSCIQRCVDQLV